MLLLCMTAVVVVKIWRREVAKGYKDLAAASIYPVGSAIRMDSRRMCVASFHRHTGCLHRKASCYVSGAEVAQRTGVIGTFITSVRVVIPETRRVDP